MTLEEYKKKKLEELEKWSMNMDEFAYNYLKTFFSQTIDELYAELQPKDVTAICAGLRLLESDYLPKDVCMIGTGKKCGSAAFSKKIEVIAEAERMRDNKLSEKR